MQCPWCHSHKTRKNGRQTLKDGSKVQGYSCRGCYRNFNERAGTPLYYLKTQPQIVEYALKNRTEGTELRATGRVYNKSHSTISRWEQRLVQQKQQWSPPVPEGKEVTVEGDEIYTRVGENLPASKSQGWTINFLERESRYWITSEVGLKEDALFEKALKQLWEWGKGAQTLRCFTDGERRYGKYLWSLASVYLSEKERVKGYLYRKVWREGVEVAMKIKGSQGKPRREWVKVEHPFTAISPSKEVHANHNEANNAAIRRRCSAYRRRQNHYAEKQEGLQRSIEVQRLVHNWCRPHASLGKKVTPAMAMGLATRPMSILEMLQSRSYKELLA